MAKNTESEMSNLKSKISNLHPLRVLMVEDSEDDALLVLRELKKGGYNPVYERVETAAAMKKTLKEKQWDIILCDYKLPQFSGTKAIALLKETNIDIPIIIVSGTIGEETAVECMRLGAHDYIMKNNLSRLVPAIERELKEAESRVQHKRAEVALRQSEEIFRRFMEYSPIYVFFKDENIRALRLSKNYETMLGKPVVELLGKNMEDLFPSELAKSMVADDMRILKEGKAITVEEELNGRFYSTIKFPIFIEGKPRYLAGYTIDITERKLAEDALRESELRYHLLFEEAHDGIALSDAETGTIVDCNQFICRMTEKDKTELLGQPQSILHPQHQLINGHSSSFQSHKTGDPRLTLEDNLLSKSGKMIPVEISASRFRMNGRDYLLGIFRDITDRNRAEEKLKDTLESLRRAVGVTVQVMVSAVETRDPYTAGHQLRSANLACAIATEMGLPQEKIDGIRMAGSIHDIGKLSIPAEILSKPTKLTNIEFSLIKEHAQKGYEMLKDVESPWPLAQIVYQHHERMNGTGYPRNLKGDDILMEARIMAVADVVEAMASHRPYRPALGLNAALAEIEINKGILYDAAVVDACLKLFREKGYALVLENS